MRRTGAVLLPLILLAALAAPVRAESASPSPEASPEATPEASLLIAPAPYAAALPIATPADANAAVLATGAPFGGFVENTGSLVGASQYFDAKSDPAAGAWTVVYTFGWGDCQAGCIDTHTFTYRVETATGIARFAGDAGADLPADAPFELVQLAMHHIPVDVPVHPVAIEACPPSIADPSAPVPSDQALPCLLPDGSIYPPDSGVGPDGTDWAALYAQWAKQYVESLPPCADGVTADTPFAPGDANCRLPDGTVHGMMPLFAANPNAGGGDPNDGAWTRSLSAAILAVLVAWTIASLVVGSRRQRRG